MNPFRGILPAVVTPFDSEEEFAPRTFEGLLERLYRKGVHGIYVCGQTGEGLLQPVAQRKRVAEVAVKNSPAGKQVIVHVGAHRTSEAIELARHASQIGAQAISSLAPNGPYSFAEIQAYYRALAAVSDVPVLIYYFPEVCPTVHSLNQISSLCEIPNVIGLKFTDFDLFKLSTLHQHGHTVFNGRDEILVAGLLMGADGGIGSFYTLVPELFLQVYELAQTGQWDKAREVQNVINELIAITIRFPLFPAIRCMLAWSGLDCGRCLEPRRSLSAQEESTLRDQLSKSKLAESILSRVAPS